MQKEVFFSKMWKHQFEPGTSGFSHLNPNHRATRHPGANPSQSSIASGYSNLTLTQPLSVYRQKVDRKHLSVKREVIQVVSLLENAISQFSLISYWTSH